jgi:hypothetical protein
MNAQDTLLTQKGAALLVAFEQRDDEGQQLLLGELDSEGRSPDALLLVAIVTADAVSKATGRQFADVFKALPAPGTIWPSGMVHRDAVVRLAVSVYTSDSDGIARASGDIGDKGHAIASAFDLADAVVNLVPDALSVSRLDWLKSLALSAAAGAGVDE